MLTVKNGNNFNFVGRFDGVDYHFPRGKTTAIPDDAARHIFGVGSADKTDVLVRHGWLLRSNDMETAMEKLNGFSFNVANELNAGDIIESPDNEQGSAPLQLEVDRKGVADDTLDVSGSNSTQLSNGGSILDKLTGV